MVCVGSTSTSLGAVSIESEISVFTATSSSPLAVGHYSHELCTAVQGRAEEGSAVQWKHL